MTGNIVDDFKWVKALSVAGGEILAFCPPPEEEERANKPSAQRCGSPNEGRRNISLK
jgi:hypothetical protein